MKVLVVFKVFVSYQQRIVIHIFHISFLQPASFVYSPGTLSLSDIPRLKVSIPSSINQLTALEYLSIARSKGLEPLPSEIGDLSNLGKIHACILHEMFPQAPLTIFFLFPVVVLNLRQSTTRGRIPTEIGKLSNLGTSLLLMMISCHLCVHVPDLSFISEIEEYMSFVIHLMRRKKVRSFLHLLGMHCTWYSYCTSFQWVQWHLLIKHDWSIETFGIH
jgi:hypothetical protein